MPSDLDIYRSAKLLINQHGEDAPILAISIRLSHRRAPLILGSSIGAVPIACRQVRGAPPRNPRKARPEGKWCAVCRPGAERRCWPSFAPPGATCRPWNGYLAV